MAIMVDSLLREVIPTPRSPPSRYSEYRTVLSVLFGTGALVKIAAAFFYDGSFPEVDASMLTLVVEYGMAPL